jgi:hypothetical protein
MTTITVNYQGARISCSNMIGIANIIAKWDSENPKNVREVYKNMVGRYPTAKQLAKVA